MANNLNIIEVTMAQLSDKDHKVNKLDPAGVTGERTEPLKTLVVRVTDHVDNDDAEQDDPEKMALFMSKAHGMPWTKEPALQHKVWRGAAAMGSGDDKDYTTVFVNHDYSTFE